MEAKVSVKWNKKITSIWLLGVDIEKKPLALSKLKKNSLEWVEQEEDAGKVDEGDCATDENGG